MHVIVGFLIVIGSFVAAFRYAGQEFDGFYNTYSLILLIGVPIGLAIATHPFATIVDALTGLVRAVTTDLARRQRNTKRRLLAVARAALSNRPREGLDAISGSRDRVFSALAERVLRQDSPEAIDRDGLVMADTELAQYEAADRFFGSLGEFAPGVGMIGTLIGLVQLLANMRDLERLGPAMAIALLTTFYGLLLAHALYLPLAKLAASKGEQRALHLRVVLAGLRKVAERKPIYEVEQIVATATERVRERSQPSAGSAS